jgi:fido (protein-threonine AMPylation protein)
VSEEGDARGGAFRDFKVWIGRADSNIDQANVVPPDHTLVPELVIELCESWNENYASVEVANDAIKLSAIARFVHSLTLIHPFGDANGRLVRAFARQQISDLIGRDSPLPFGSDRNAYVEALANADKDDFDPLVKLMSDALVAF